MWNSVCVRALRRETPARADQPADHVRRCATSHTVSSPRELNLCTSSFRRRRWERIARLRSAPPKKGNPCPGPNVRSGTRAVRHRDSTISISGCAPLPPSPIAEF